MLGDRISELLYGVLMVTSISGLVLIGSLAEKTTSLHAGRPVYHHHNVGFVDGISRH
jgi:hypothetical protein